MQGEKKGPVLEVRDLTKIFSRRGQPSVTAVDRVSFSLMPGECLGIIGESGSGKSTLVNMITRLIDADSGQIFLKGRDITRLRGRALRSVYSDLQMHSQGVIPTKSAGDSASAQPSPGHWPSGLPSSCAMKRHQPWMSRSSRRFCPCCKPCAGSRERNSRFYSSAMT